MFRYLMLILPLILIGCASSPSTFNRPADLHNPNPGEFPSHYDALSADLFWRCKTPDVGGRSVEGYAVASTRENLPIRNFSVTLFARDAKGSTVTRRATWGDRLSPSQFQPVPFTITVPAAEGVARYDLFYSFHVLDGREQVSRIGTVEDACGERWRRKT